MDSIIGFVKKEAVLTAAWVLAVASSFVVPPDAGYGAYIDYRTLCLLLSLMIVVSGFRQAGLFKYTAGILLKRVKTERGIMLVLTFLCFFFSMLITNDVALITFVPFCIVVLKMAGAEKRILKTVIMQTAAANLGSMFTPVGNPQNLYLFAKSGMTWAEFLLLMLPYTAASAVFIAGAILLDRDNGYIRYTDSMQKPNIKQAAVCLLLFAVCFGAVGRLFHYGIALAVVAAYALIFNRQLLKMADYSLIATFVGFFVFIGNMGRITALSSFMQNFLTGREVLLSVSISQIISNVPAALMLSGFSDNFSRLIIGVNLGGLGTLIASMASLISYKQIARTFPNKKGEYIAKFTFWNVVFLAGLAIVYQICCALM